MRVPLLLMIALAALACRREAMKPDYPPPPYMLSAYTNSANPSATDSIICQLYATWPSTEPIVAPWSGPVTVYAWRSRRGDPPPTTPSRTGTAILTIEDGSGDSVRVTLAGSVTVTLEGRMPDAVAGASGTWTCDATAAIGGTAPGEARGIWYLGRELSID